MAALSTRREALEFLAKAPATYLAGKFMCDLIGPALAQSSPPRLNRSERDAREFPASMDASRFLMEPGSNAERASEAIDLKDYLHSLVAENKLQPVWRSDDWGTLRGVFKLGNREFFITYNTTRRYALTMYEQIDESHMIEITFGDGNTEATSPDHILNLAIAVEIKQMPADYFMQKSFSNRIVESEGLPDWITRYSQTAFRTTMYLSGSRDESMPVAPGDITFARIHKRGLGGVDTDALTRHGVPGALPDTHVLISANPGPEQSLQRLKQKNQDPHVVNFVRSLSRGIIFSYLTKH